VAPGATWVTEYEVTQRPMTAWYHPHPMHQTARQVYMGLAGVIYVDEPTPPADLPSTYGVDDLPLVIQDRRFFADGTHPYSGGATVAMHDMMAGLKGQTMLVIGAVQPRGVIARGLVRLRLLNGSNARTYHLGFADGRGFRLIASDGGLPSAGHHQPRLAGPGERVGCWSTSRPTPPAPRSRCRLLRRGVRRSPADGANLADGLDRATFAWRRFEVGAPLPTTIVPPPAFAPIVRMAEADAARTRALTLGMAMGAVTINGTQMTDLIAVPAAISFDIPVGDVELWTITNTSGMPHPLHVHHRQFQVLDVDGAPPAAPLAGWKDTVMIGPGQVVRLLLSFAGVADREVPYMFHCHILEHEDHGMMGRFFLIPP
jgi:FtsP/CotA-like multicopper oxidase with cupredoxin domain